MPEAEFNKISEDKYRKFPVNWLPEDFNAIQIVAQAEYDGVCAQYIRRTIKRDLRQRGLIGPNAQVELFQEYVPVQMERRKIGVKFTNRPASEYADPPRKFSGFMNGLNANKGVAAWFRKRKKIV